VIRNKDDTGEWLHSKPGATQGDPVVIFSYAIGVFSIVDTHKVKFLMVRQPW
jgi:hypothetical protein